MEGFCGSEYQSTYSIKRVERVNLTNAADGLDVHGPFSFPTRLSLFSVHAPHVVSDSFVYLLARETDCPRPVFLLLWVCESFCSLVRSSSQ